MSYETLEKFLNKKELGCFWMQLEKRTKQERIDELCEMLLMTAAAHIDERAAFLWEALLHAIDDLMLQPLLLVVNEFGREEIRILDCVKGLDADAIKLAHRRRRVALAKEIYVVIPAFQEKQEWNDTQRKNMPVQRQTLLALKNLLWTEAASWWRGTRDEAESLALFDWLLALEIKFTEERDALREIVRAHSGGLAAERLLAQMSRVKQYRDSPYGIEEEGQKKYLCCTDTDEWLKHLLHAWIRQQKPIDAVNQLTALAPVAAHGPMAWDLLRQMSQPLGEFCLQARLLREFIRPEKAWHSIFDAETTVRYEKLGEAIIEINANNEAFTRDRTGADVDLAAKAKQELGDWVKHHAGIRIMVRIGQRSTISASPGFNTRLEFWIN